MPVFDYTALGTDGQRRSGTIDAPSKELAMNKLREEGLTPLVCEVLKEPVNVEDILARIREVPQTTLVYFSRQLAVMIGAGMSPVRSLAVMEEQEDNVKFKAILGDVINRIEAGEAMHEAFEEHPEVFTKLYTAMLRAGEESGNLATALAELATQLEKALRLRRAIKSAAIYPIIMGCVAFFVISALLIIIVPEFANLFVQTVHDTEIPNPKTGKYPHSTALPLPTRIIVTLSHVLYPVKGAPTITPKLSLGTFSYWIIQ
jgi:type IV pilus assembly protein PilC